MPADNIDRATRRGTGDGDLEHVEDWVREGPAAHGLAVRLEILTADRCRTAPVVRPVSDRYGVDLGSTSAVA